MLEFMVILGRFNLGLNLVMPIIFILRAQRFILQIIMVDLVLFSSVVALRTGVRLEHFFNPVLILFCGGQLFATR